MRINRILSCAGMLLEPNKGKDRTMAPMRMVRRRKMMRVSGVRSESVMACQRQKLQQMASNFPAVKMATGNVKFLRRSEGVGRLTYIIREVGKQGGGEGQQHLQHPGETQQQDEGHGQNLGDEHEGLFLHLGNRLKDTDGNPNHEASQQRGGGQEDGGV